MKRPEDEFIFKIIDHTGSQTVKKKKREKHNRYKKHIIEITVILQPYFQRNMILKI